MQNSDVSGPFWAALTHPRCDEVLQEKMCRDMHMLQHQAGACVRADLNKFRSLLEENVILTRELGRVQGRLTRLTTDKTAEIARLQAQLVEARAQIIAKDSSFTYLTEDMETLRASIPDLESRTHLKKKNVQLMQRQATLETHNAELRHSLSTLTKTHEITKAELAQSKHVCKPEPQDIRSFPITVQLHQKAVLCVGGRSGNISNYRAIIERVGGRFAHHDGGLEDNTNLLDASLAAADLVICQTACISHNAYWRVKDFCKRTGKRCIFVENPSAASLARGLEQCSGADKEIILEDNAMNKFSVVDD